MGVSEVSLASAAHASWTGGEVRVSLERRHGSHVAANTRTSITAERSRRGAGTDRATEEAAEAAACVLATRYVSTLR